MTMPSHAVIHDFWTSDGLALVPVGAHQFDYCEPCCYACEWAAWRRGSTSPWNRKEKRHRPVAFAGLERAHVVPRSRGGSDKPSNIALLCKDCHRAAPNTDDAAWFWQWIADRPNYYTDRAVECLRLVKASLTPEEYAVLTTLDSDELLTLTRVGHKKIKTAEHWGEGGLNPSTFARTMIEGLRARADH